MKKHKFLSIFAIMFALVFALSICFFAACGSDDDNKSDNSETNQDGGTTDGGTTEGGTNEGETTEGGTTESGSSDTVKVSSVVIDSTLSLTLGTNETGTLTAAVVMSDGNDYTGSYTWESSDTDEEVISVTSEGDTATVTAVDIGDATITVTVGGETMGTKTAKCKVTVGEILPNVSVDFSDANTYSWITTVQETEEVKDENGNPVTDDEGNTQTQPKDNYYEVVPVTDENSAYTNGILSLATSYEGMIVRTDKSALATGGEASNESYGNYFEIDLTEYKNYHVNVSVDVSNTGSNKDARSLLLATEVTTELDSGSVLAYITTENEKNTNEMKGRFDMQYSMAITEKTPSLYLTWTNSVYIYSINVTISRVATYTEAPTSVAISCEDATDAGLVLSIPEGYDLTTENPSEAVTATLVASATNEHNMKYAYAGEYNWKVTDSTPAVAGYDVIEVKGGVVTAISAGTATVKMSLADNPEIYATIEITVEIKEEPYVSGITISGYGLQVGMGDNDDLTATVVMSDGSDYTGNYTWTSSAPNTLIVTGEGATVNVKWLSGDPDTYTLTLTLDDGSTCVITFDTSTTMSGHSYTVALAHDSLV